MRQRMGAGGDRRYVDLRVEQVRAQRGIEPALAYPATAQQFDLQRIEADEQAFSGVEDDCGAPSRLLPGFVRGIGMPGTPHSEGAAQQLPFVELDEQVLAMCVHVTDPPTAKIFALRAEHRTFLQCAADQGRT
jgi:hypothetical protein